MARPSNDTLKNTKTLTVMKTYVLIISKVFPCCHPKKGHPTYFKTKLEIANAIPFDITNKESVPDGQPQAKYHTIHGNYNRWYKRFEEIYAGKACLSLREWSGRPYYSKQVEIARLTNKDKIGLQMLRFARFSDGEIYLDSTHVDNHDVSGEDIALNDGLKFEDWERWMQCYDLTQPLAIIQLTKFRY